MHEIITLKPGFTFYHTSIYNTNEAKEKYEYYYDMGNTLYGQLDLINSLSYPKYFGLLSVFPYVSSVIKDRNNYGLSKWTTQASLNLLILDIGHQYNDNMILLQESEADGWLRYDDRNSLWYEAYILEPYKFFDAGEEISPPPSNMVYYDRYPMMYRLEELNKLFTYKQ